MGNFPPENLPIARSWTAFGLPCLVLRGPWSLNGYVCVPADHPDYDKHYDQVDVRVHGGLTFAESTPVGTWFGFDTMHAFDWGPGFPDIGIPETPGRIWTLDDVVAGTHRLARQQAARRFKLEKDAEPW
jgi:hypothetical protein